MTKDSTFIKAGAKTLLGAGGVSLSSVVFMLITTVQYKDDAMAQHNAMTKQMVEQKRDLRQDLDRVTGRLERNLDRMENNNKELRRLINEIRK